MARATWFLVAVRIAAGAGIGLFLSVLYLEFLVVAAVGLLMVAAFRVRRGGWRRDVPVVAAALTAMTVCALLPVKQLDVEVGPIAYQDLTLHDLCDRLREDHGVICSVWDPSAKTERLSFSTDHPMSKRQVLEKLSEQTGRRLRIGYCGTSATILWGAWPSFTYLAEKQNRRDA